MTKRSPIVTDHAVLRYLERVYGVDISGLRKRIERQTQDGPEREASAIISMGVRYALSKSGRVVTVTGVDGKPCSKRGRRWRKRQGK